MRYIQSNSRLMATLARHKDIRIIEPSHIDSYNGSIRLDGVWGTIRTRIDAANMDFVAIPIEY